VFSAYWALAGQLLGPEQRAAVEAAIREAAAAAELAAALPLGGSLAAWLLAPRRGSWLPWAATMPHLPHDRPGLVLAPGLGGGPAGWGSGLLPPHLAAVTAPGGFHYFRHGRSGSGLLDLFVPSPASQALEAVAALALQAGLAPLLLGEPGSGRRSLLWHLLATQPPRCQRRSLTALLPGGGSGAAGAFSPASLQVRA
jgi:hypothetical protein